jgi:hypothetical protein
VQRMTGGGHSASPLWVATCAVNYSATRCLIFHPIISVTACHQRNYVATQSKSNRASHMRLPCKAGELPCKVALANASHSVARVSPQQDTP